jgi:hypothetical protein
MTASDHDDPFEELFGRKSIIPRSNLRIPPPRWLNVMGDRSVRGNITGSVVVTGDHNTTNTNLSRVTLPPADSVDLRAELAALRQALAALNVPRRDWLDSAFRDAETEAAQPAPDKQYVANAVQRVLEAAKGADSFADQVEKWAPRVAALASWAGPAGRALLTLAGLGT